LNILGEEIYRCYDQYGPIRLFKNGPLRYLTFGLEAEQSCINMDAPHTLMHQYTQGMILALLFQPKPKRVTLLGLGAGCLVHALHGYDAGIDLVAVELREKVVTVAQQWFGLESVPNLVIYTEDAVEYMTNEQTQSDFIFADIYNDDGMMEAQLSDEFMSNCFRNLSENGVLVMNLWDQGGGSHPQASQAISDHFQNQCISCEIDEGNLIAYAFKGGVPEINRRRLLPLAKGLGKKLNIPAVKLLNRLKQR